MPAAVSDLQGRLRVICGAANVVGDPHELVVYGPGSGARAGAPPLAVALPASVTEAAACVAACVAAGTPWRPRGANTWLPDAGTAGSVTIALTRMRRILDADPTAGVVRAEAGVPGHLLLRALAAGTTATPSPSGAPGAATQDALAPTDSVATLGGLLAAPHSGPRALAGHRLRVLAVTLVLPDGELVELNAGAPGYDLLGRFLGSAGAFGVAVEATIRLGAPA